MSFVEEQAPRFSFTATPVTELDIEALLDMWDDPSPVLGFSLPPLDSDAKPAGDIPLSPTESTLSPTSLSPSPTRIPRSHSLLNLRYAARGSFDSSAGSASTASSSPSPSFPPTPTSPPAQDTALFPSPAESIPKSSQPSLDFNLKPLPPIQLRPTSVLPPSPTATEDLLGLEDLFGPPRANPFPTSRASPFPTISRNGSVSSDTPASPTSLFASASAFPAAPSSTPRRGSAISTTSSPATSSSSAASATPTRAPSLRATTFAARLERFEAPLPLPRGPATTAFDPSQGGKAAFTAPRAAPTPAAGVQVVMQQYPRPVALKERQTVVYPRPRPPKEKKEEVERGKRERETSAGSMASSGSTGGVLSRWL